MLSAREFVHKLGQDNEALFRASELQIKAYYDSNPSQEELVDNFIGRMVNERMNMVEISNKVANMPEDADPDEVQMLAKQALDEAKHFRMVRDVVEHLLGHKIDMEAAIATHKDKLHQKGASLIAKYEAQEDELMLALYQFVAEGRAARNWAMMSQCIEDPFIASTYAKIAKDEKFHSDIGRLKLEKLCRDEQNQQRVVSIINEMRRDLFAITCSKTGMLEESRQLMENAYN
jgi:rubrerythrin